MKQPNSYLLIAALGGLTVLAKLWLFRRQSQEAKQAMGVESWLESLGLETKREGIHIRAEGIIEELEVRLFAHDMQLEEGGVARSYRLIANGPPPQEGHVPAQLLLRHEKHAARDGARPSQLRQLELPEGADWNGMQAFGGTADDEQRFANKELQAQLAKLLKAGGTRPPLSELQIASGQVRLTLYRRLLTRELAQAALASAVVLLKPNHSLPSALAAEPTSLEDSQ